MAAVARLARRLAFSCCVAALLCPRAKASEAALEGADRALLATPIVFQPAPPVRAENAPLPAAVKGRADAPITLTVFGNFACPNTARLVHYGVLDELLRLHPETLRVEFRHFSKPHPEGVPFALRWTAVRALAPGAVWPYFEGLFACRLASDLTPACAARLENSLGLDAHALDAAAAAPQALARQADDDAQAARLGVNATPTLLLDGALESEGAPGPGCAPGDEPCLQKLAASFAQFTRLIDADVAERERALGLKNQ